MKWKSSWRLLSFALKRSIIGTTVKERTSMNTRPTINPTIGELLAKKAEPPQSRDTNRHIRNELFIVLYPPGSKNRWYGSLRLENQALKFGGRSFLFYPCCALGKRLRINGDRCLPKVLHRRDFDQLALQGERFDEGSKERQEHARL